MVMAKTAWAAYVKGVKARHAASLARSSKPVCPYGPSRMAEMCSWMGGVADYETDPVGTLKLINEGLTNDDDSV